MRIKCVSLRPQTHVHTHRPPNNKGRVCAKTNKNLTRNGKQTKADTTVAAWHFPLERGAGGCPPKKKKKKKFIRHTYKLRSISPKQKVSPSWHCANWVQICVSVLPNQKSSFWLWKDKSQFLVCAWHDEKEDSTNSLFAMCSENKTKQNKTNRRDDSEGVHAQG